MLMCAVRDFSLPPSFFDSHPAMASSLALSPLNIVCRLPLMVDDSLRSFGQAMRPALACVQPSHNEPAPGVHLACTCSIWVAVSCGLQPLDAVQRSRAA